MKAFIVVVLLGVAVIGWCINDLRMDAGDSMSKRQAYIESIG